MSRVAAATGRMERDGSVFGAPLVLVVCVRTEDAWVRGYDQKCHADIDATIVCDQMMMQATDLGLGTCWVCHFDPVAMREALSLPEGIEPVHVLPIAMPTKNPLIWRSTSMVAGFLWSSLPICSKYFSWQISAVFTS